VQTDSPENSLPSQLFFHFGLRENPFGVTPDIRFLYQSRTHREALASLINGIDFGFGFQVLVGQPGMGKTSLLFNLLDKFRSSAHTAFLFQPQSEPQDLLQSMLYELGTSSAETSLRNLFEQVNEVLYRAAQEDKRVILVVDEAQNLQFAVLEALRQLSNFETPDSKLLQVVLAGQPHLAEKLADPAHEQLRQRISAISRLSPLGLDETAAYINHRLATAGYSGADLFTEGGVRLAWNRSKGVPRNINTLCFGAMVLGFAERAKSIDERLLEEAARDLDLNSALADVFAMEPAAAAPPSNGSSNGRDNGKVQPGTNALPETDPARTDYPKTGNGKAIANEERVASANDIPDEAEIVTASAHFDNRKTEGASEYIPPAVVAALARITQALEEQRLLLTAKSAASSQSLSLLPVSLSPVIPLSAIATEGAKTPASFESALLQPPTAIERSIVAAIPGERTAEVDTNSPLKTAETEEPAEPEPASEPAPQQAVKVEAKQNSVPHPAALPGYAATVTKRSATRVIWTKALSFGAAAGILAVMLIEKFPLTHLWTVKAGVPAQSAAQESQPASYSLPGPEPAPLIVGSSSVTPGSVSPDSPDTNAAGGSQDRRVHRSNPSQDVVVQTFPTDVSVTEKNANDKQELRRIFFNEDSDTIDAQYRPWLQQIAETLAKDPTAVVTLEGHTDGLGRESHNRALSSRRAMAVRNALVNELHVSKARLTATGVGSGAPLQPNSSAEGRAYNRRVEVRLKHSRD
jgi:type II secretory pathway predicted ATPase ExeA/outer membrane protein OmpA-like peptidoglycan-associated protein